MISLILKVLHRNSKVLILNTLFYSAISLLLFLIFYLPTLDVIESSAFRIKSIKDVSVILFTISGFFYVMLLFLNSIDGGMKRISQAIDSLNIKAYKKGFIYILMNLIPVIYSLFFSHLFGFIFLIILHSSLNTSGNIFINIEFYQVFLPIIITPVLSFLSSIYNIYEKKKSMVDFKFDNIALALFIIATFLLVFSTKNDVVSIIFYVLLILLIPYAVLQLYSYIQLIRGNTKTNKKDYSALLFRRFVHRGFIVYLFLSFVFLTIAASNHMYSLRKYDEHKEYQLYDYEISINNEEEAITTLSQEIGIRYTLMSDSYNMKLYDDTIPLYFTDLTMISEFLNIKSQDNSLINEEDMIVFPSYFKDKYNLVSGEKVVVMIDNKYRFLKAIFIDEATDFIAFAYNISETEISKTSVLINVLDKTYDIDNLKERMNINDNSITSFSRNYDRLIGTSISSSYLMIVSIIGIVIFLYFRIRKG